MHRPQAHPSYQRMYSSSMTWNGWKELRVHIYLKDMLIRVLVTCKCNVLDCKCIAFFMLYCIAANMWLLKTVKIICSLCVVQKCFVLEPRFLKDELINQRVHSTLSMMPLRSLKESAMEMVSCRELVALQRLPFSPFLILEGPLTSPNMP